MTFPRHPTELNYKELSDGLADGKAEKDIVFSPRRKRFKNNNEESRMQRYLVKWWTINCKRWNLPDIALFSIPNGGNWDARRGSIMKAEGQKKGAPDLMLAKPKEFFDGGHIFYQHGLFLELKTAIGRLSPEQVGYHSFLSSRGYRVAVVRSTEEAIREIENYLT